MKTFLDTNTKRDILRSFGSSGAAIIACSPLEVLKMNAQVTSNKVTIRGMARDVYRGYGLRGFYKGLAASLCGQPGYWSIYFPIYNNLKKRFKDEDGTMSNRNNIGSIFTASLIASMTVNPLFVFKTRFQTAVLKINPDGTLKNPKYTYAKLIKEMATREGVRGFYKGNFVAQIKNTQMMLQMPLCDWLRNHPMNPLPDSNLFLIDRTFISGVIAKTVASCMVYYPIDCIRTNLRNNVENKSIARIVKDIYTRPGGVSNFYRGVGIYWVSAVPTFGIIMYLYRRFENFNKDE